MEESFEVMFVPEKEIQQVLTRYEGINWRRLFSKVGGGGGRLALILSLYEGGLKISFA